MAQAGRMISRSRSVLKFLLKAMKPSRQERRRYRLESSAEFALFQEAVVVAHEEVGFHLTHRIQENADENQHARAAEELSDGIRDIHDARQNDGDNCNDSEENSA